MAYMMENQIHSQDFREIVEYHSDSDSCSSDGMDGMLEKSGKVKAASAKCLAIALCSVCAFGCYVFYHCIYEGYGNVLLKACRNGSVSSCEINSLP
jgi:hypothetical protein